jgi:single-strand DNA-binding protein
MSMSNFVGEGNIGRMELRRVPLRDEEQKPVLNLSVRVNVDKPVGEGDQRTWEDKGGRWILVEYWGKRAQMAETALQVGARVIFGGELSRDQFPSRDNPEQMISVDKVRADWIAISPICIESVQYRTKKARAPEGSPRAPEDSFDVDIPF